MDPPLSRLEEFYQYGLEVRHLPLYKALQGSQRCVTTAAWMEAREELRFGRLFDRMVELRQAGRWSLCRPPKQPSWPQEVDGPWHRVLREATDTQQSLAAWSRWKRLVVKQLALEAAFVSAGGLRRRQQKQPRPLKCTVGASVALEAMAQQRLQPGIDSLTWGWNLAIPAISPTWTELASTEDGGSVGESVAWSVAEDRILGQQVQASGANWAWVSVCLNVSQHGGRSVRTLGDCRLRHRMLGREVGEGEEEADRRKQALRQEEVIGLILGQQTKIVTPKTAPTGKPRISLNSHPSHEQAARKATQNISKMLTPAELALRRLQKPTNPATSGLLLSQFQGGGGLGGVVGGGARQEAPPRPPSANAQAASSPHRPGSSLPPRPPVAPPPRPPTNAPQQQQQQQQQAPVYQQQQQQALLNRTQAMGSYLSMMATATAAAMRPPHPSQSVSVGGGSGGVQSLPSVSPAKREASDADPAEETPASSPVRQLRRHRH